MAKKPKGRGRRQFGRYDRRHNSKAIEQGLHKDQELKQADQDEIDAVNATLDDGQGDLNS